MEHLHRGWPLITTTLPANLLPENPSKKLELFMEDLCRVIAARRDCDRPYKKATLILGTVDSLIALHEVELSPENAKTIITAQNILKKLKEDLQKIFKEKNSLQEIARIFRNLKKESTQADTLYRSLFDNVITKILRLEENAALSKKSHVHSDIPFKHPNIQKLKPLIKYLAYGIYHEINPKPFLDEEQILLKQLLDSKAERCFGKMKNYQTLKKELKKERVIKKTLDSDSIAQLNNVKQRMNVLVIFRELSLIKYNLSLHVPSDELESPPLENDECDPLDIKVPRLEPYLEAYYDLLSKQDKVKSYPVSDFHGELNFEPLDVEEGGDSPVENALSADPTLQEESLFELIARKPIIFSAEDVQDKVKSYPVSDFHGELNFEPLDVEEGGDSPVENALSADPTLQEESLFELLARKPIIFSYIPTTAEEVKDYCLARIGDALRGTLIVDNLEQIPFLITFVKEFVESRGGRLYIKNLFENPNLFGYVGLHLKIRMPIPTSNPRTRKRFMLMELQIHVKKIMDGTLTCPKEDAHEIYKNKEKGQTQEAQDASKLIYLMALETLKPGVKAEAQNPSEKEVLDLIEQITQQKERRVRLGVQAVLFSYKEQIGLGKWDESLKAFVPAQEGFTAKWADTLKKIQELVNFPVIEVDEAYSWTNTARSIDGLLKNAKKMGPFFKKLCHKAAKTQPGCKVSFGNNDQHMIKEKKSLQDKLDKDMEDFWNEFPDSRPQDVKKSSPQEDVTKQAAAKKRPKQSLKGDSTKDSSAKSLLSYSPGFGLGCRIVRAYNGFFSDISKE